MAPVYAIDSKRPKNHEFISLVPFQGNSGISDIMISREGEVLVCVLGLRGSATGKILTLSRSGNLRRESYVVNLKTAGDFFRANCAQCHGNEGRGDGPKVRELKKRPQDLTSKAWHESVSDETLARAIKLGGGRVGKSNEMPGWGLMLTDKEIKLMVRYVRRFRQARED